GSGKTTLMLASVEAISSAARTKAIAVDAATPGISKDVVMDRDHAVKTASGEQDSQCLFIRSVALHDREIIFHDISGVEFEPREDKVLFEEYFNYTDGVVFMIDPLKMLNSSVSVLPQETFESFRYMFSQIRGKGPDASYSVPFAVVLSKADQGSKIKDSEVREFLVDNGQQGFVRLVESTFTTVRYFSVSSVGDSYMDAVRPVWWIVSQADDEIVKAVDIPIDKE
ncbi:MAG: hypothetical protein IJ856_00985, partial [Candidatus Methanomethylophilaceae archaeon]|nr:hypothetical protein [Candidatus Methanomethylophilaceae archaeon]